MEQEILNRIAEALRIRNMKQVELAEKTGLSKASINSWLRHRWQPKQDALLKMAKALDVSEMWLAGYDVPMERPTEQKKADVLTDALLSMRNDMDISYSVVRMSNDEDFKDLVIDITKLNKSNIEVIKAYVSKLVEEKNKYQN
jgi:transcriptional regulator with XRE-family HTH domain